MAKALEIAAFADGLLRTSEIQDYPYALNGLQVQSDSDVCKIAAAVDYSTRTVRGAIAVGANLVVVHHGAFWSGLVPLTGKRFDLIREIVTRDLAIYSSHLPLDCHPKIGNNVLLAERLGLTPSAGFGTVNGINIGVGGESSLTVGALIGAAVAFAAENGGGVHATPSAKDRLVGRWGLCSGSGADSNTMREAAERGIQTLVVGEGPHWTAVHAEENEMVLIYAGHYATETLGVQALASVIGDKFGIPWEFIPAPTGT